MKELVIKDEGKRVRKVRELISSAGNLFCSVHFRKREDNSMRKMCCRLHTIHPTYSGIPKGKVDRKAEDRKHNLITVFDTNLIRYNNKKRMCGRGGYKSIPLEGVERIKVGGVIYRFR